MSFSFESWILLRVFSAVKRYLRGLSIFIKSQREKERDKKRKKERKGKSNRRKEPYRWRFDL